MLKKKNFPTSNRYSYLYEVNPFYPNPFNHMSPECVYIQL